MLNQSLILSTVNMQGVTTSPFHICRSRSSTDSSSHEFLSQFHDWPVFEEPRDKRVASLKRLINLTGSLAYSSVDPILMKRNHSNLYARTCLFLSRFLSAQRLDKEQRLLDLRKNVQVKLSVFWRYFYHNLRKNGK